MKFSAHLHCGDTLNHLISENLIFLVVTINITKSIYIYIYIFLLDFFCLRCYITLQDTIYVILQYI